MTAGILWTPAGRVQAIAGEGCRTDNNNFEVNTGLILPADVTDRLRPALVESRTR